MEFSKVKADLLKQMVTSIKAIGKMEHLMVKDSFLTNKVNKLLKVYGKTVSIKENVKASKQS